MVTNQTIAKKLDYIYRRLLDCHGPQHWWPADEPFEVMVGAILTQSCAWGNVEKAISSLKRAGALSATALRRLSLGELASLIRPCGYHHAKAFKLKCLCHWLGQYYSDELGKLFAADVTYLRQQLLSIHGIGAETADSIILYAAQKPVFVIDAYTRRIVSRLGLAVAGNKYADYQTLFAKNLPADVALFNEYHALLVCLGKQICRKLPLCHKCCLSSVCHFHQQSGRNSQEPSLRR